ncbi:Hsp70 family protein [Gilvimarinus algae]|uniref:Hsp70 family protein n=1 Tax=Gilvimarinus algae TaxID=3058037 RepID=A0ABT8TE87_9GAMM|nr:Hsp70 family protein [Gilvimarinus sp. SDUM040014]MDO3382414.1 Hsp70 family protein [Gilvimarinus sp. SDUM040014]
MALIGIDLGTTNSLVGYWIAETGEAKLIRNTLKKTMTPSVVGLDDHQRIVVGDIARHRLITHPSMTVSEFKRYMGTDKEFKLGDKKFRAEELSALLLKSLIADAESHLSEKIDSAVISVPAYFSDAQRKATRDAGRLAGIEVKRLINEPTAAAIAYGLHETKDDTTFLIFDIGGGTFDVSILELFDGVMQVNATAGDNRLGGEDFVDSLLSHFLQKNGIVRSELSAKQIAQLRSQCEQAMKQLSTENNADIEFFLDKRPLHLRLSRDSIEACCGDLLRRLRLPLERSLRDANLQSDDLDAVVLVGGASRMPAIRSMVSKMLGKIPRSHINPDETVALGAAIQAALIEGDASLSEVVLTDVAPYTLGVGVVNKQGFFDSGELFHPIIDRNSPVPVSRIDRLVTVRDNQTTLHIVIYQGEARLVKDNIKLGELSLAVPPSAAGEESVDVRFTYDISGLLQVEAEVTSTGVKQQAIIEGNPGALTETEIKSRLAELASLKVHPRENEHNALLVARGERLYELALGDLREYIKDRLGNFEQTLQSQNISEINEAAKELTIIFDQIERESPLL